MEHPIIFTTFWQNLQLLFSLQIVSNICENWIAVWLPHIETSNIHLLLQSRGIKIYINTRHFRLFTRTICFIIVRLMVCLCEIENIIVVFWDKQHYPHIN